MKLPVFDIKGKSIEAWNIDEKSLGVVNNTLLSQAIRVYESNSHQNTSRVKTRGEVVGSTRKIYRQKGTGNARHGARYAPIFVGGGIAHGPKGVRPGNLVLPKKMRAKALGSSLLLKLTSSAVSGLETPDKFDGKSSSAAALLNTAAGHPDKKVLVVTEEKSDALFRGMKNLQQVLLKRASIVNAYDLVYFDHVLITKSGLDALIARATMKKTESADKKVKQASESVIPSAKVTAKPAKKDLKTVKKDETTKKAKAAAPKTAKKTSGGTK